MKVSEYDITEYGAVADGRTVNTRAIQRAVDTCAAAGGGRVVVPGGVFVSGAIFLKSNIEFHLSAGAVLRGSRNFDDYPMLDQEGHGYHIDHWWHASLLTGYRLENMAITGHGILDGQGDPWWRAKDAGGDLWENGVIARQLTAMRPALIHLFDCERVRVDGVKLWNSPSWTVVPILCRNLIIHGINIVNPWKPYHNCDGIDLVSCNNVQVSNCYVDTGDDGICLKTVPDFGMICGPDSNGRYGPDYSKPRIPCENVVIRNCVVEHAHSGVGIWAEVIGGMRNIAVSNCVFDGTRTGIRIARYPWPGGYVRDVRVDNIIMRRVEYVIELSSQLTSGKMAPGPDAATTPEFDNLHFSNITATQATIACEMYGLPEMPSHDISFSNLRIESDLGFNLRNARNVLFDNVSIDCRGVALIARDVTNLELRRFNGSVATPELPVVQIEGVRDAWVHGCTAAPGTDVFLGLVGDDNDVLMEGNRMRHAAREQSSVEAANAWNICSHAYSGSRVVRETGSRNAWLPVSTAVWEALSKRWTQAQINRVWTISRVEPNARNGAEVDDPAERRRIYIIEAHDVDERLVIFEDGELLRTVEDPDFHAHVWNGM